MLSLEPCLNRDIQTLSAPPPIIEPNTQELRNKILEFLIPIGILEDASMLTKEEQKTAKQLKTQVLLLYSKEKLYQIAETIRNKIIPSNLEETAVLALECWKNKNEWAPYYLLLNIAKTGDILWQPAPDLPENSLKKLVAEITLFLFDCIEKKSCVDYLKRAIKEMDQDIFTAFKKSAQKEYEMYERKHLHAFAAYVEAPSAQPSRAALEGARLFLNFQIEEEKKAYEEQMQIDAKTRIEAAINDGTAGSDFCRTQ